MSTRDKLEHLK